jgi:hypothetical protein
MAATEPHGDRVVTERVKRRRPGRIIAAVAAAICLALGVTIAAAWSASAGASAKVHKNHKVHKIHIVTTLTSAATNSAGLGGPGDVVAQVFSFEVSPGVSGHLDASVQFVSSSEVLSHAAFVFPQGQIQAQAAITQPPTSFTAAVTGGTEAFEGVSGQVINTVISRTPLTIDRTLYLIYPDEG